MKDAQPTATGKGPTPLDWLQQETRNANPVFAKRYDPVLDDADITVERYTSREFHDREMRSLWSKCWQMVCHGSQLPEVGSFVTYEIGRRSYIIVRVAEGEVRAYVNSCLHRGMTLTEGSGKKMAFTCSFHGWVWDLDGALRRITEGWDFPQCEQAKLGLRQAQVAQWGGFVFINPDPDAPLFADYIGALDQHFASDPLDERKVALHAARIVPCNWKIAQEAFMEAYHVMPTHPQSVPVSEYAESQCDFPPDCPNSSRLWTVSIAPISPKAKEMEPQEFADYAAEATWREKIVLKPGQTYRNALADERRADVARAKGRGVDHLTDGEMLDAIQYMIFPNFLPWYGYGVPIAYRFRPNGDRHDSSIMEVFVLAPRLLDEPCPPAPETLWVGEDEPFSKYPQLGRLGPIFDQDLSNIPGIQRGLEAAAAAEPGRGVPLSLYQEARIRHLHRLIDTYLEA